MAKTTFRIEGLSELDAALGELPKATARNVLVRTLKRAGEPIAARARELVPVLSGHLKASIAVSTALANRSGKAAYHGVKSRGGSDEEAIQALRDARRGSKDSYAEVYVGPGQQPHAHLVEFGSVHNTPQPYMRPAWDEKKEEALSLISGTLGDEITKAAERLGRKRARAAATAGS